MTYVLVAASLCTLISATALLGWLTNVPELKSVLPGAVQMKANTAVALLLLSLSLLIADRRGAQPTLQLMNVAPIAVTLIGLATLGEYWFDWRLNIDELLFADRDVLFNPSRGRMSPYSAVAFTAFGAAMFGAPLPRFRPMAIFGASVGIAIGVLSLLGYLWRAPELTTDQWLPPVAVNTAVAFLLLGPAILRVSDRALHLHSQHPVGRVERKVLTGFAAPLLLFCIAAGVTYSLNVRYGDTAQWVGRSYQVRTFLGRLLLTQTSAEAVQHAMLEDRGAVIGTSHTQLVAEARGYVAALRLLLAGDVPQLQRLDALSEQMEDRFRVLASTNEYLRQATTSLAEQRQLRATRIRVVEATRAMIDAMDNSEVAAIERRTEELARTRTYTLVALIITLTIATAALLTLFSSIVRELRARERIAEELEKAQREMRRATNAKSDFLAAMSHEIRTPMNGVIGMLDVLSQSSLQAHQMEMVQLTRESADALVSIIDDILDFSKIEAGKLELEEVPLSVFDSLERTGALLNRIAENRDVTLLTYVDPRLPPRLIGDPYRMQQVMINLVNNAIKFSSGLKRHGRVQVRATLLEDRGDTARVELTVADNGVGMTEQTQMRLFSPFTQADSSTTRRYGGTGLGLIICKRLVALMGGEISVRSQVDVGTTFTVQLTLRRPTDATGAPAVAPAPSALAGRQCLVTGMAGTLVDDVCNYLEAEGLRVVRHAGKAAATAEPTIRVHVSDVPDGRSPPLVPAGKSGRAMAEREVLITTDRTQLAAYRAHPHEIIVVDGNALKRTALAHAVARAAGIAIEDGAASAPTMRESPMPPPSREAAVREHRLILAAEDNIINQKVIRQQLNLLGFAVEFAGDGAEALRMWHARDYSLVLTDLHMPEMDGYDLTLAIRVAERGRSHVPIVALSTNALQGEAERCHAVGMDDYVTKPATVADLNRVLQRYLPNDEPLVQPDQAARRTGQHVDLNVLRALVGDDPAMISELLNDYRTSAERTAEKLGNAIRTGDLREALRWSHNLKSSSRSIGGLALGELCERIESHARAEEAEPLAELWQQFQEEFTEVLHELPPAEPKLGATGTNGSTP